MERDQWKYDGTLLSIRNTTKANIKVHYWSSDNNILYCHANTRSHWVCFTSSRLILTNWRSTVTFRRILTLYSVIRSQYRQHLALQITEKINIFGIQYVVCMTNLCSLIFNNKRVGVCTINIITCGIKNLTTSNNTFDIPKHALWIVIVTFNIRTLL